jgi:hypothetical protein
MPRAAVISTRGPHRQVVVAPGAAPGLARTGPAVSVDPATVARRLAPALHWPEAALVGEREWRLVASTPDFDAWLIAWPPGGQVALHDHGNSAGAVAVINGVLTEAMPRRDDAGRLCLDTRELLGGTTLGFTQGHVHDVTNESGRHALSLHVYSPALTHMTQYELTPAGVVARGVSWTAAGEAVDVEASGQAAHAAR